MTTYASDYGFASHGSEFDFKPAIADGTEMRLRANEQFDGSTRYSFQVWRDNELLAAPEVTYATAREALSAAYERAYVLGE